LTGTRGSGTGAAQTIHWRAATLGVVVIAITIIPTFLTGALSVQIREDVGLDLVAIGGFYAVLFGVSALTSATTGRFVQRRGWESGIRISAGGTGMILAALAVLPDAWWESWWPAALFFAIGGVTAAISQAGSNLALSQAVPPERYGLAFGLKHTAVPVAAMLAGLAVPAVALTIGWRWAYVIVAILAFVTMLAVPARSEPIIPVSADSAPGTRPSSPIVTLAALAVAAALAHIGLDAMTVLVVPYAVSHGVSAGAAGVLLTFGSLAGLTTRLTSGFLVDRRQHTGLPWIAALLLVGSGGFLLLATGGSAFLTLAVLVAFAGAWGWAGLLTFVVVRANPGAPATATAIANTGKYVGAAAGPALAGVLAEQVSFEAAWWVGCGLLMAAAIIVSVIRLTPSGFEMANPPSRGTP